MDDATLVAAARGGSNDAFTALYKKHLPYVKAAARAILRSNDLDDICQETFLLAFTRIESFQGNSNFRTWVTRIAMNQCLMALRRNRQVTNGGSQLLQLDTETVSADLLDQCVFVTEDANLRSLPARFDLPKLLQVLKPGQRKILEMAYLEDIPDQQIADRMGITLASVKSTLHHAKKRVREVHKKS
ncbi:MAG TPA: RNA polymerase sigma factor [Acidobacteriaceae bacterium]|nr:RNA polymerase sigma factor [Acidobacteriaceae bacterium]